MPRLMIKYFGSLSGEVSELEDAKYLFDLDESIIVIEGQNVRSYEELVQIVSQERFKDKEFIEVMQIPLVQGG